MLLQGAEKINKRQSTYFAQNFFSCLLTDNFCAKIAFQLFLLEDFVKMLFIAIVMLPVIVMTAIVVTVITQFRNREITFVLTCSSLLIFFLLLT